jgi:hypothetical protein
MPDDDDDGLDGIDEDVLEAWFTKRMEREQAKRDRSKAPKDFGEGLDRMAGAVADELERRAEVRRQAREDADQEPSRPGNKGSGFLGLLGGESRSA